VQHPTQRNALGEGRRRLAMVVAMTGKSLLRKTDGVMVSIVRMVTRPTAARLHPIIRMTAIGLGLVASATPAIQLSTN
jgi:hypothetical protein